MERQPLNRSLDGLGVSFDGPMPADAGALEASAAGALPLDGDLTKGVGTPFYISPEQLRVGGTYNRKVDMYALGIMLFEMTYPIATAMERHRVLGALRESGALPVGFETQFATEAAVVTWLLNHDPKKRPTARQLLESELLPSNLDQEIVRQALCTIHPNSTTHADLMRRLFSRQPDPRVDYTYDFNSVEQPFGRDTTLATMHVADVAADVARKRGALRVDPMLLMPMRSGLLDSTTCAQLLDESGLPVALPFDLTVPFARFVAHNKITSLRRYSIERVFRRNPAGGQPRALLECDFDVVGHASAALQQEAEAIGFCCEFFEHFAPHDMAFAVMVNHAGLQEAVLASCAVRSKDKADALKLFGLAPRYTPERLVAKLKAELELPDAQAALLGQVMALRGPYEATLTRLRTLLGAEHTKAYEVCRYMKRLGALLSAMGILEHMRLDLSLPVQVPRARAGEVFFCFY